jgi:ribonuclease-3 family protein
MEKGIESSSAGDNSGDKSLGLIQYIKKERNLPESDIRTFSPLTLAFIGDGVYDLIIRTIIVEQGNAPVNKLHKRVSNLVKAPAQMDLFHKIEGQLSEDELSVYKRGRNAKSFTSAKNASITEYCIATGLEALVGYLYLTDQFPRIIELVRFGLYEAESKNISTDTAEKSEEPK